LIFAYEGKDGSLRVCSFSTKWEIQELKRVEDFHLNGALFISHGPSFAWIFGSDLYVHWLREKWTCRKMELSAPLLLLSFLNNGWKFSDFEIVIWDEKEKEVRTLVLGEERKGSSVVMKSGISSVEGLLKWGENFLLLVSSCKLILNGGKEIEVGERIRYM